VKTEIDDGVVIGALLALAVGSAAGSCRRPGRRQRASSFIITLALARSGRAALGIRAGG